MTEPTADYDAGRKMPAYVPKTKQEIAQLAFDIIAGRVFSVLDIPHTSDYGMVFLPLMFLEREQRKQLLDAKINFIYEYLDKAGPRSVNGMPIFMSMQILDEDDAQHLMVKLDEMVALRKKFVEGEAPPTAKPKTEG